MTTIYLENERVEVAEPSDIQDLQFQINQLKKDVEIAQATLRRAENAAIRKHGQEGAIDKALMDTDEKLDKLTRLVEDLNLRQRSPWLTIKEAARYARMGESTVVRAIDQGLLRSHLPPAKDSNNRRRAMAKRLININDLDRFIRNETGRGRRKLAHEIQ